MQEINPGEPVHWKNKLEQLDQLPDGPSFDKNAAWEKLQNRSNKKHNTNKIVWYRFAAACLLIAFISGVIFFNNQASVTAVNNQQKNTIKPAQPAATFKKKDKTDGNMVSLIDASKSKNTAVIINKKIALAINNTPLLETVELIDINKEIPLPEIKTAALLTSDTTSIFSTAALSVKKKLKVVHNNELGDPITEPRNLPHPDDYGIIQFKLINQQVYNSSPLTTNSIGINISKSKTSPPN